MNQDTEKREREDAERKAVRDAAIDAKIARVDAQLAQMGGRREYSESR